MFAMAKKNLEDNTFTAETWVTDRLDFFRVYLTAEPFVFHSQLNGLEAGYPKRDLTALEPQMVGEVLAIMRTLAKKGITMIIVTHEMAFARDVSNHVVFMADGVIEEEGGPENIFGAPQKAKTQEFLSRFIQG